MSALPVPAPPNPAPEHPARSGRKPAIRANSPRSRKAAESAPNKRPFAGKDFVGFETWLLDAIRHGCYSQAETNLILFIAEMADRRERGNPLGRTGWIMQSALAEQIDCSTQNINCSVSVWFYDDAAAKAGKPTGLVERFERKRRGAGELRATEDEIGADKRAYSYQIRADYARQWLKNRMEAKERDRKARKEAAERRKGAPEAVEGEQGNSRAYRLRKPVQVGPSKPFRLPPAAREAIRENCTAIAAKREVTITEFSVDKGVLTLDFAATPAATPEPEIDKPTCRSQTPAPAKKNPTIDKSTCGSLERCVANKELSKSDAREIAENWCDEAARDNPTVNELRRHLDQKLIGKTGAPIDGVIFRQVVEQLGGVEAVNEHRSAAVMAAVKGNAGRVRNWKFLVSPSPATKKSIIETVRIAEDRKAEIGAEEHAPDDTDNFWERQARRIVHERRNGGPDGR